MKALAPLLLLVALLAFAGCKSKGSLDSNGVPDKLVIAVVQAENIEEVAKVREQMRAYLEKKLGIPVEMISANDYTAIIEALRAKKVHMADIPPFAYVVATRKMKLVPLVTLGQDGKPSSYSSVIIANGHSKINDMNYVKAHSKELTLAFVEAASTSGHLIPRAYLNTIGLNPDSAFKQVIFAGNHIASVLSVKSGKVDIGCTTDLIFKIIMAKGMLKPGDVKVIWKSDPIVTQPIVIRPDISPAFAKKVQQAYLDMDKEQPEILKAYLHLFLKDTAKRTYIVANDSMYNGLRKIASGVKDLKAN